MTSWWRIGSTSTVRLHPSVRAVVQLVSATSIWRANITRPYAYSSFHERFSRSLGGNGAGGRSLLDQGRAASCYRSPSTRQDVWPLICLSLKGRLICGTQCCTVSNYTAIMQHLGLCDLVWRQRTFVFCCSASLGLREVWPAVSECWKMAPRRKSETCAPLSVSAAYVPLLAPHQFFFFLFFFLSFFPG